MKELTPGAGQRGERGELCRLGCLLWPPSPPDALQGTAPAGSCARPPWAPNSAVTPCPPWPGDRAGQGQAGSSRQRTFLLDHGVQLLPDAIAPAWNVHMQCIVAAGLAISPLPPPLQRLGQAGLRLWHHMIHCRGTAEEGLGKGSPTGPFHCGLAAPPPQAGLLNSFRAAPKRILSPSQHALAPQVHLLAGKCTEPLLNGLWHRTRCFYTLLLRNWLEAEEPCLSPSPLPPH